MKKIIYLFILLSVQACSNQNNILGSGEEAISKTIENFWIENSTEQTGADNLATEISTPSNLTETPTPLPKKLSSIEIVWLYPEHRVTNYILRYGTSEDNLDSVVEFPVEELKTSVDPEHGKVYTYLLRDVPAGVPIYYSLQAKNFLGLSEPTPIAVEKSKF